VESVAKPSNVLATRNGPSIPELAALGVRRVSTGGALARAAYGALIAAARELQSAGTSTYLDRAVPSTELETLLSR
jgi:2-methylisocitrate lyase-like PEP mutase family enzyme